MRNILTPKAYKIIDVRKESNLEYTFKVETDIKVEHGQFLQLSIPKVGEAPISVSGFGDGYLEFTIRSVGKVTDKIFTLQPGDTLFLRGSYGKGWPVEKLKGKNVIIVAGGTGVAPVRSMINMFFNDETYTKSVNLICGFKDENSVLFKDELAFEKFGDNYEVIIVGPPMMMKFTSLEFVKLGVPEEKIYVSFERKMSCAVGKCGHCRVDETYVCLEGPVFNYTKAKDLLD